MSAIETATLPMMLTELRLPTIKRLWPALAEQSNREGWPAERFLAALCEHEMHERETRRIDRHRAESRSGRVFSGRGGGGAGEHDDGESGRWRR